MNFHCPTAHPLCLSNLDVREPCSYSSFVVLVVIAVGIRRNYYIVMLSPYSPYVDICKTVRPCSKFSVREVIAFPRALSVVALDFRVAYVLV